MDGNRIGIIHTVNCGCHHCDDLVRTKPERHPDINPAFLLGVVAGLRGEPGIRQDAEYLRGLEWGRVYRAENDIPEQAYEMCRTHNAPMDVAIDCSACGGEGVLENDVLKYVKCWNCKGSGTSDWLECELCLNDHWEENYDD